MYHVDYVPYAMIWVVPGFPAGGCKVHRHLITYSCSLRASNCDSKNTIDLQDIELQENTKSALKHTGEVAQSLCTVEQIHI